MREAGAPVSVLTKFRWVNFLGWRRKFRVGDSEATASPRSWILPGTAPPCSSTAGVSRMRRFCTYRPSGPRLE